MNGRGGGLGGFADALLAKVKNALRITGAQMDDELTDIINACWLDLRLAGVLSVKADDPLIIRAVVLYAKANFSFSADSGHFHRSYDAVKNLLRLAVSDPSIRYGADYGRVRSEVADTCLTTVS